MHACFRGAPAEVSLLGVLERQIATHTSNKDRNGE